MPYPDNVVMAKKVEQIMREEGSIPATIAIMVIMIKIRLSDEDLETLAKSKHAIKVSRSDLVSVIALKTIRSNYGSIYNDLCRNDRYQILRYWWYRWGS